MADSFRIAFLIVDLEGGGAQKLLTWIAPRLAARGAKVEVIAIKDAGRLNPGVPVRRLHMRAPWDLRAIPRLVGILRDFRPHVLHTHLVHANFLGRLCGRLARVPHIRSTLHTLEGPAWHGVLERLTAPLADSIEFVSAAVAAHAARRSGLVGEVVRYGVPDSLEAGPRLDPPMIVTASRLVLGKGIDDLIQAVALITDLPVRLQVLGDGHDSTRLKHFARIRGLAGRVDFPGWADDLAPAWRGAAAAAFPSRLGEGSPVAVLEAMMAGLPVVATDAGGTREIVEDGVTGWLVRPGNVGALADRIEWIVRNPVEAALIARRARAVARERFDIERTVDHLERVYRS